MEFESFHDKLQRQRTASESADRAAEIEAQIKNELKYILSQVEADIASCLERAFTQKNGYQRNSIALLNKYQGKAEMFIRKILVDPNDEKAYPESAQDYSEVDWFAVSNSIRVPSIAKQLGALYLKRDFICDMRDAANRNDYSAVASLVTEKKHIIQQGMSWWRACLDRLIKLLSRIRSVKQSHFPVLYAQLKDSDTPLFGASVGRRAFQQLNCKVSEHQKFVAANA